MVARLNLLLLGAVLFAACGAPPAPTARGVIDLFIAAGLEAANPHRPLFADQGLFPRTFSDGLTFDLPSLGKNIVDQPRNGSVLVCDTKENCDTIYDYLDTYSGLVGPYYYRSQQGTVVVFLDSNLPKATAARYEQIVQSLP
ncbi:MAG TPA: hypothetical protein VKE41_13320 [Roseiflexaceae bacterium]|nr:hypothetical protein [Roseiflexaceae bacterium]